MMAEEFGRAVEDGLRLAKRLYFGKDRSVAPPKPMDAMEKVSQSFLPTAPMVYAVISDPAIVDNPDIPSYQPHVHGRCDPPALIPLHMNGFSLEVDCFLDTVYVTLTGSWRVHCVMGSRRCDCRIAIPMGEQGSILGVEVEVPGRTYLTELTDENDQSNSEKVAKPVDGGFITPHIFTLTIPQVDGGSNLSIKAKWSQKLVYRDGQFTLTVPFAFPEYVTPPGKKIPKKEHIQLNVNAGPGTEVLCKTTSHPLKELRREVGKLHFSYESEVLAWSSSDFVFVHKISSAHISGGVLLQSPALLDSDRREMFCCYVYPGDQHSRNMFRKEVIFVVDISGSMKGKPLESTKNALFSALEKLDPQDFFSVIAFNGGSYQFSTSLEPATSQAIENVTQWINMNFVAGGGTNILTPLNQALEMLSKTRDSIPIILLITDGAVEDERHICDVMRSQLENQRTICPRIYTFGIGSFCNHHFLRMLAVISRGQYDAAFDPDSIEVQMERLFSIISSTILANINFDFDDLEVYPPQVPDLSSQSPLIVSGRYRGTFPDKLKAKGLLPDMSTFSIDLKIQESKDMLLNKVLAKQQIEILTAQAWFSQKKEIEEKVARLSVQNAIVSEYTRMVLLETERGKADAGSNAQQVSGKTDAQKLIDPQHQKTMLLQNLGIGFGNLIATAENIPPGASEEKPPEAAEVFAKAASNCCGKCCSYCCGMCCIKTCSRMNDQCAIVMAQVCAALSCFSCLICCGSEE